MAADLILTSGHVWTGAGDLGEASAVAVADGRVLAVGPDSDIRAFAGAGTKSRTPRSI